MPIQTLKVGSLGTHNTLGLAKAKGARFFLASTSEVYGDPQVHPQPETYWGHVNPIGPRGVYDEAKRFAEAMTMAYHRYHGLDVRIVRIFNTYGPRMRPDDGRVGVELHRAGARRASRSPSTATARQTRSFCYVDDEVRGLPRPARQRRASARSTSATPHEFTDPRAGRARASRSPARRRRSSTSRCRSTTPPSASPTSPWPATLLGWEPQVPLREGLARTAAWFESVL